jgi:hypothetical protein
VEIVKHMSNVDRSDDIGLWKWRLLVLEKLGADGMSSDDTSFEEGRGVVFRVRKMPWRREITGDLRAIEAARYANAHIFNRRGARPITRIRDTNMEASKREPVHGLPIPFYDHDWFVNEPHAELKYQISKEGFTWYRQISGSGRAANGDEEAPANSNGNGGDESDG